MIAEEEVAKPVRDWFLAQGWDVYCEVVAAHGRCDIVAVNGPLVWIVEVKNTLSLKLIAQAHDRIGHAHFVSIATPAKKKKPHSHVRWFTEKICADYGIGSIVVTGEFQDGWDPQVREAKQPRFNRRPTDIRPQLYEAQRHTTPGLAGGGYVTPFTETLKALRCHVAANPGCTMKEAMGSIRHHYASSISGRACMMRYIRDGIVKDFRLEPEPRPARLFLAAESA